MRLPDADHLHNTAARILVSLLAALLALAVLAPASAGTQEVRVQSLTAQGKSVEAAEVGRRLEKAWQMADVKLTASRF